MVHLAASSFAVAHPDDDDHVQGSLDGAVACEVEPVAAGAPARRGVRRGSAQVSEGRPRAGPADVLARGDEQGRGVVIAASETGHRRGRRGGDQPVEPALQIGGLGADLAMRRPRLRSAVLAAWAGSARRSASGRSQAHTAASASRVRRPPSCVLADDA